MKFHDLIRNEVFLAELRRHTPNSKFSGNPLSLCHNPLSLVWENSMDPDWWVGAQDGVYTRQDRRPVSDETIRAAALAAGIPASTIDAAFVSRVGEEEKLSLERAASAASWSAEQATKNKAHAAAHRAKLIESHPYLLDTTIATAAVNEMDTLLKEHRNAVRMTRKLAILDENEATLAHFTNLIGMKAWLFQNGFRPSIDDREHFMNASK